MTKPFSALLLLPLLAVAGCAAEPADDPAVASDSPELVAWNKVLTCDGGAAALDVDTGERRNLQFVIRDQRIVGFFANQVRVSTRGIIAPSGEIILHGRQNNGVWSGSDFRTMDGWVDNASIRVSREGGGVKVVFYQQINWSKCSGGAEQSPSTGMCPGGTESGSTYNELANWYFRDCR
jgi:hypothetical protein